VADFVAKQGTTPVFAYTLLNADLATSPNVTAHTVNFVMRSLTGNDVTINATATLVVAASGQVSYTFTTTDTATAGRYQAYFQDTTAKLIYPIVGELTIDIQENLTTPGGARLVTLGDVKDHLNIPAATNTHDLELLLTIDAVTPVVENITGPILQRSFTETYDGGGVFISTRHRPLVSVESVSEYRGPIRYDLTQVATIDAGTIYSYTWEPTGRIVRRTVGGGVATFPPGPNAVTVKYTAGYAQVPANVSYGTKELIRVNYQQTQQAARRPFGGGAAAQDDTPGTTILGFFVPNRVRELLAPSRRHPSIA